MKVVGLGGMEMDTKRELLERLDRVISVFGGDMSRWPYDDLIALKDFVLSDVDARARLAEDEALDALLRSAPAPSVSDDLMARVLSAASGKDESGEDQNPSEAVEASHDEEVEVVLGDKAASQSIESDERVASSEFVAVGTNKNGRTFVRELVFACCLAVSLFSGVYLGVSGVVDDTVGGSFSLASVLITETDQTDTELFNLLQSSAFEDGVVLSEELL